jgi:hypothetical protein
MTFATRRERVLQELRATGEGFLKAVDETSEPAWGFKPAEGRWSVAETAEHTTLVLDSITEMLVTRLLEQPLPPRESSPRITDDQIIRLLFDRSRRRDAPAAMQPTGRYASRAETVSVFTGAQGRLIEWVSATDADLREFGAPHPALGKLDGVQWLLFLAAHTERHTRQILETRGLATAGA